MPVVGQRSWTHAQVRENTRAVGVKKHQDGNPLIPQSGEHGPAQKPKKLLDDERNLVVFSVSRAAPPRQALLSVIGDPRLWSGERMWWGGVGLSHVLGLVGHLRSAPDFSRQVLVHRTHFPLVGPSGHESCAKPAAE